MHSAAYDKPKMIKYLLWTFALAWLIQIGVALLYANGHALAGRLAMAAMMFVPTLGVVLAGQPLKGLGWKPEFRKNWKTILIAWFGPAVLTAVGAALYFLVFPGHFDLSGEYVVNVLGPQALEQIEAQGISYPLAVALTAVSCVTYAPVINTFVSLGEEIGWRGFLYPQLKAKFGSWKGRLIGGVIWGAWHWPLIWLIGYEYGTDYFGFPAVGMLAFLVFTVAAGILCDGLYEKSGSIWLPSLCHGAINAAAVVPLLLCVTNTGSAILLGPVSVGLLAGLPLLAAAIVLAVRVN